MRTGEVHHIAVYMCEPWFERTLYGVYDTWSDPAGHENVQLAAKGEYEELGFFTEYRDAQIRPEKVGKVIHSMHAEFSQEIYKKVYTAPLSQDREWVGKICRFPIQALRHGPSVLDVSQLPACYDVFGLCRNVYDEDHLLTEFLRFSETPGDILVPRIGSKNDIMTLLTSHPTNRLPEENWATYDENHRKATVHPAGRSWFFINQPLESEQKNSNRGWSRWLRERTDEGTHEGI